MKTYEESLKVYWDNYSVLKTARDEGVNEGIQIGLQEGVQEGLLQAARELKKLGVSVDIIIK